MQKINFGDGGLSFGMVFGHTVRSIGTTFQLPLSE
jgi:hypothetical protein